MIEGKDILKFSNKIELMLKKKKSACVGLNESTVGLQTSMSSKKTMMNLRKKGFKSVFVVS